MFCLHTGNTAAIYRWHSNVPSARKFIIAQKLPALQAFSGKFCAFYKQFTSFLPPVFPFAVRRRIPPSGKMQQSFHTPPAAES